MTQSSLVRRSTHIAEFVGLKDEQSGLYLDTATAVVTIYDPDGNAVAGATNIVITHVNGTTGATTTYRGSIGANVNLGSGLYTVRGTVTDSNGNIIEKNLYLAPRDG